MPARLWGCLLAGEESCYSRRGQGGPARSQLTSGLVGDPLQAHEVQPAPAGDRIRRVTAGSALALSHTQPTGFNPRHHTWSPELRQEEWSRGGYLALGLAWSLPVSPVKVCPHTQLQTQPRLPPLQQALEEKGGACLWEATVPSAPQVEGQTLLLTGPIREGLSGATQREG